MKKFLVVGLVTVSLVLAAVLTLPVFAHGPEDDETTLTNQEAWQAMHEACATGDWEAMVEAAEEVHGEDFNHMPYHSEGYQDGARAPFSGWGGMGGHMGGGMMGGMH